MRPDRRCAFVSQARGPSCARTPSWRRPGGLKRRVGSSSGVHAGALQIPAKERHRHFRRESEPRPPTRDTRNAPADGRGNGRSRGRADSVRFRLEIDLRNEETVHGERRATCSRAPAHRRASRDNRPAARRLRRARPAETFLVTFAAGAETPRVRQPRGRRARAKTQRIRRAGCATLHCEMRRLSFGFARRFQDARARLDPLGEHTDRCSGELTRIDRVAVTQSAQILVFAASVLQCPCNKRTWRACRARLQNAGPRCNWHQPLSSSSDTASRVLLPLNSQTRPRLTGSSQRPAPIPPSLFRSSAGSLGPSEAAPRTPASLAPPASLRPRSPAAPRRCPRGRAPPAPAPAGARPRPIRRTPRRARAASRCPAPPSFPRRAASCPARGLSRPRAGPSRRLPSGGPGPAARPRSSRPGPLPATATPRARRRRPSADSTARRPPEPPTALRRPAAPTAPTARRPLPASRGPTLPRPTRRLEGAPPALPPLPLALCPPAKQLSHSRSPHSAPRYLPPPPGPPQQQQQLQPYQPPPKLEGEDLIVVGEIVGASGFGAIGRRAPNSSLPRPSPARPPPPPLTPAPAPADRRAGASWPSGGSSTGRLGGCRRGNPKGRRRPPRPWRAGETPTS